MLVEANAIHLILDLFVGGVNLRDATRLGESTVLNVGANAWLVVSVDVWAGMIKKAVDFDNVAVSSVVVELISSTIEAQHKNSPRGSGECFSHNEWRPWELVVVDKDMISGMQEPQFYPDAEATAINVGDGYM